MDAISKKLSELTPEHREALEWFQRQNGTEVSWPAPLASGIFLVNKAKGIHKPAGWKHALSVRESLQAGYPDRDPTVNPDGSWTYQYFQEKPDASKRDSSYTNLALLACQRDGIPVGVIRQVKGKPNPRYKVLGLALVRHWRDGYFELEGLSSGGPAASSGLANYQTTEEENFNDIEQFSPTSLKDARLRVTASIVRRQGQGKFRRAVLSAYGNRCAISGCDLIDALEAAHIYPYLGVNTNVVNNGLLLRSDLHTLYDLGLIAVDPHRWRVAVAPRLRGTVYASLSGTRVKLPIKVEERPSHAAVERHLMWARSTWSEDTPP